MANPKWTRDTLAEYVESGQVEVGIFTYGTPTIILHGAEIGDGAVVGARAVVAGKVEPYSVVVGNPAKEIHKRFDQKTIDVLMKVKWWDWPVKVIVVNLDVLTSPPDTEKLEYIWRRLEGKDKNQNQ